MIKKYKNENNFINKLEFYQFFIRELEKQYWKPLHDLLKKNPEFGHTFPALILIPNKIILYFGKTHIGIEYSGPERLNDLKIEGEIDCDAMHVTHLDNDNLLEYVVGFKYYDSSKKIPLFSFSEDLTIFANDSDDKLRDYKWNFSAKDVVYVFNPPPFYLIEGEHHRLVNAKFFTVDKKGKLKIRYIKWIDFIPIGEVHHPDSDMIGLEIKFSFLKSLIKNDINYIYPLPDKNDYQYSKLPILNKFVEVVYSHDSSETDITQFLAKSDHHFILKMAFFAKDIFSEKKCAWQSEQKKPIKPDFFVVRNDGYADIVEFKLPQLKSNVIVGSENRETASAEINKYISQARTYKRYFEDPNNRKWVENTHGLKMKYPKRILVLGRRSAFQNDTWKEIIDDYNEIEIITYDDVIEGVLSLLYC